MDNSEEEQSISVPGLLSTTVDVACQWLLIGCAWYVQEALGGIIWSTITARPDQGGSSDDVSRSEHPYWEAAMRG